MARYWIGPWVWQSSPASHWAPPANSLAALDLRSVSQCATPGPIPSGVGLFVTANAANLGSDYRNLGTDLTVILNASQRSAWQTTLNLPAPLAPGADLRQALRETLFIQADPTGEARVPPGLPTTKRELEVRLGEVRIARPWDITLPDAAPVRELYRRQYRALRQRCLDGQAPPLLYRKVLGFWTRKLRVPYRWFQPDDLPDESDLPPETTISESFNKADSDTLGPDLTWTEVTGDGDIVSNRAECQPGLAETWARAESDLSSDDHYAQVTRPNASANANGYAGPVARFAATAHTGYGLHDYLGTLRIYKMIAGTPSNIGTGTAISRADNDTYKIEADGSSIKACLNGVEREAVTDSGIAGHVRCGFFGYPNGVTNPQVDSFTAADLAAGTSVIPVLMHNYRRRRA